MYNRLVSAYVPAANSAGIQVLGLKPAVEQDSSKQIYDAVKAIQDLLVASVLFVLFLPLMGLIAAAILVTSGRPIIFRQQRLTRGGKIFTIYKFRTMEQDAEKLTGPIWAKAVDPRNTRLGRILRRTRLDELPQLLNVLKGEMTLIGPRPERPEIAAQLSESLPAFERRLEVKAGITGLAQVRIGYPQSVDEYRDKLQMDLAYIEKRSLALDLQIYLETLLVVVLGSTR